MIEFTQLKNVLVVGSIAYDEIMDFPDSFSNHLHPEKLHALSVSFVVNKLEKQLGGTATSIAYNFALLKKVKVGIIGAVGRDGDEFITFYKKHGIDTKNIVRDKNVYTATGKVITDLKNNQIWGFYYGAAERVSKVDFTKLNTRSTMMVLAATHTAPFKHMQKSAIAAGLSYLYDPGMALTWIDDKTLKQGVMNASIFVVNDYEMGLVTKRLGVTVEQLVKKGITCITTLGAQGARYQDGYQTITVGGYTKSKVVDPTGAGDTFRAGFISGMTHGRGVIEALKMGNATASFVVESYGTTNHHPTMKKIQERMKTLKVSS